ncbi:MAG: hypothetical protein C0510_06690 [Erythrobacter sp.]|nr:hypothetical protein [Erythrobacter sp.]
MGGLLGIPEWLAKLLFVATFVAIIFSLGWRNTSRSIRELKERRISPSREEFLELMEPDVSPEASEFLWDTALFYIQPHLTPHPDDDLIKDLPIDEDDIGMDWPRDWAKQQGFHDSNLPEWPEGWLVTIRNYGRWLDMGPQ